MIEIVLYQLTKNSKVLIAFLSVMLLLFFTLLIKVRKLNNKNIKLHGIFMHFSNIQIILLGAIIIRTFYIIYSSIFYDNNIFIYLTIIIITSLIYIILKPKKIIFESISLAIQVVLIYFIHILQEYQINVGQEKYVLMMIISLIILAISYSIYGFFRNFEEIIKVKGRSYVSKKANIQNEI